jgi:MFS superfamily sulfate permease-like transporter
MGLSIQQYQSMIDAQHATQAFEVFLLSLCIAGVLQILLGIVKAGIIGYYFPSSVIKGMLCGIGLLLIAKEIPHFLGDDRDPTGEESFIQATGENTVTAIITAFRFFDTGALIIGSVCLFILILWQSKPIKKVKWLATIPGPLLAVAAGIGMNQLFMNVWPVHAITNPAHMVNLPNIDSVPTLISKLHFPDLSALSNYKVWETAFVLCCVASLESLLSIEAIDKLDPENRITPTNRELIAQGTGNLVCGLIGGLPVTSVIVRSSTNVYAGARTRMSAIFHGVLILAAIFIFPKVLNMIPNTALAAILIMTGWKLTRPVIFKSVYRQGLDQFLPFIITIVVFLLTDLLKGVAVGIIVGVIFILRQNYRNPYKYITDTIDGVPHYFIKLSQNVTFLNKGKIIETLHSIPPGSKVYIDGGRSQFIDKDVLEAITEFKRSAHLNNITVELEEIEEVELISAH